MRAELLPGESQIFAWIAEVFNHGIRRPGYAADRWAEEWTQASFSRFGLVDARAEPVAMG